MPCRLCGKDRKLIKAHAIPEAFFRVMREQDGEIPLLITNAANRYPKRSPIGVYDKEILCEVCEECFGPYDKYGTDCLIHKLDEYFRPIERGEETLAFSSNGIDQERLKLFVLSVLWRAAVSTQEFYSGIDLGPYEEALRKVLLAGETQSNEEFAVALSRWVVSDQRKSLVTGLMNPFRERWSGVNAVRLYLGWVVAYVKVDQRSFPSPISEMVLGKRGTTIMVAREFDDSKDLDIMRKVAKDAARNT